jgi:hypothetical protein
LLSTDPPILCIAAAYYPYPDRSNSSVDTGGLSSAGTMDGPSNGIVVYHYSFSPFARRVLWYLALRGLDYAQCVRGSLCAAAFTEVPARAVC